MKTLKNRVLSGAMAGVLAMSLAVPAFAADNTTTVTGTYKAVTIDVTVPETGVAFINPYALEIEVPESEGSTTNVRISGQQIVSAPMAIQNKTAMDLSVSATVTGEVDLTKTDMKLATSTTKGTGAEGDADYVAPATGKSAFVYLQAKPATDTTGAAATLAAECAAWAPSAYAEATDVIVGTRAVTKDNLATLRAATVNSGTFVSYNAGSIALFRLTGDCVAAPRASEWKTTDTFKTTIAFTFAPATIEKYAITFGTHTSAAGAVPTVSASPTTAAAGDTVTITATGVAVSDTNVTATVTPAGGTASTVTMTHDATTNTTYTGTFTMPAGAVEIVVNAAA